MPLPWLKQLDLPDGAYLVGGCVRDFLLTGEMGEDIDIVLEGDAGELAKSLFEKGVATAPPEIYSRFGTAMVRVAGRHVEIASARSESYSEDSRKPNTEMATLKEDMVRRDFTVNALMMDADTQEVVDLLGTGLSDLENRILRTPADPDVSFSDDPLRTLRAVRFKHRLGFEYGEGIEDALTRNAKRLEIISAERIRDELLKMLRLPTAHEAIEDLRRFGLLEQFWPELCALHGVEQGFRHRLDAWGHTLEVLRLVGPGDLTLSLAALLHDIAKPQTRKVDEDGRTRFFGHTEQGAPIAKLMINRLRIGQDVAADTALLIQNHMRLGPKEQITDRALRRLVKDMGDQLDRLLSLMEADGQAGKTSPPRVDISEIRERLKDLLILTPRAVLKSPLDGIEIAGILGISEGPRIGQAKEYLTEQVLDGALKPLDKEAAAELLKTWSTENP